MFPSTFQSLWLSDNNCLKWLIWWQVALWFIWWQVALHQYHLGNPYLGGLENPFGKPISGWLREAIKKKTYEILDIAQTPDDPPPP